MNFFNRKSA